MAATLTQGLLFLTLLGLSLQGPKSESQNASDYSECLETSPYTEEDLDNSAFWEVSSESQSESIEDRLCLLKCIMEKDGLIGKDGEIDEKAWKEWVEEGSSEEECLSNKPTVQECQDMIPVLTCI